MTGPYLNEMWLNDIGQVRPEGRENNHFGMYTCADGRTFEGHNVDNHFDCMNLQTHYRMGLPTGETYEGNFQVSLFDSRPYCI